jgi:hypothetical protein
MNLIRALVEAYIHKFQLVLLISGAMVIATIGGVILSKLIIWVLGLHPGMIDSILPVCFLVVLAGEAFAYQRYLRWRFFKDLTK